jgi:1,4-dihydroxy-2-naphthoate octaprenyltransferase
MLTWYQSSWASIADRPKNAPAAIAPVWLGSHSRAARYMA